MSIRFKFVNYLPPIETNSVYPKIVYSDISSSADCGKKKWFWPIASNRLSQVPHGALLVQTCSQSSKLHKVEQARFSSNTKTLIWNQYSVWNLKPCDLQQLVLLLLLLQCLHCFQFGFWSSGCWLLLCCWEKSPRVDVCDPDLVASSPRVSFSKRNQDSKWGPQH